MPSFKPKTNKIIKVGKKYSVTLDSKHKEFINEFNNENTNNLPILLCSWGAMSSSKNKSLRKYILSIFDELEKNNHFKVTNSVKIIICKRSDDESHKPNHELAKRLSIELIVV